MGTFYRWLATCLRLGLPLCYTALLMLVGTAEPGEDGPGINDKLAHALGFGSLALLSFPATRYACPRRSWRRRGLLAFAFATLAGAALEVWQSFLPYRTAEWLDLVADAVGAAVGAAAAAWVRAALAAPEGRR